MTQLDRSFPYRKLTNFRLPEWVIWADMKHIPDNFMGLISEYSILRNIKKAQPGEKVSKEIKIVMS